MPAEEKNLITPQGFDKLSAEYNYLWKEERPRIVEVVSWAASNGDRSENGDYIYGKKRLREIDRRLRYLSRQLETAEIINPELSASDRIGFGASCEIIDEDGEYRVFILVGEDETEPSKGLISWKCPIGQALLGKRVGDFVSYFTPKGERSLEVITISYKTINL